MALACDRWEKRKEKKKEKGLLTCTHILVRICLRVSQSSVCATSSQSAVFQAICKERPSEVGTPHVNLLRIMILQLFSMHDATCPERLECVCSFVCVCRVTGEPFSPFMFLSSCLFSFLFCLELLRRYITLKLRLTDGALFNRQACTY